MPSKQGDCDHTTTADFFLGPTAMPHHPLTQSTKSRIPIITHVRPSRTRLLLNAGVSRSRTALTRTSVCCTMASVCRPAPSGNKVGCAAPPGSDVGCAAPSEAKAGCAALLVLPCCNRRARSRSVERKTRNVIYEPKAASHSSRTRPPCERGKIPLCFILPLLGSHIYYFWLALAL